MFSLLLRVELVQNQNAPPFLSVDSKLLYMSKYHKKAHFSKEGTRHKQAHFSKEGTRHKQAHFPKKAQGTNRHIFLKKAQGTNKNNFDIDVHCE